MSNHAERAVDRAREKSDAQGGGDLELSFDEIDMLNSSKTVQKSKKQGRARHEVLQRKGANSVPIVSADGEQHKVRGGAASKHTEKGVGPVAGEGYVTTGNLPPPPSSATRVENVSGVGSRK